MGLNMTLKHLYDSMAINDREYRREYSRIRSILQKRYATFKGSKYEAEMMARWNQYGKLKDVTSPREFARILNMMYRDLKAGGNTLSSYKKRENKGIEKLKDRGLKNINEENISLFNQFMDNAREKWLAYVPSEVMLQIWNEWSESGKGVDELWKKYKEWVRGNIPRELWDIEKDEEDI